MTKEEYIRHNYGTCAAREKKQKCFCLTIGWLGTACHNWQPISDEEVTKMLQYFEKDEPTTE